MDYEYLMIRIDETLERRKRYLKSLLEEVFETNRIET